MTSKHILGVPIGSAAFVRRQLEDISAERETQFHRIPLIDHTQACWLLLLTRAATKANFWLRAVRLGQTEPFAKRHDSSLGSKGAPDSAKAVFQLPFSLGGLATCSARLFLVSHVYLGATASDLGSAGECAN